VTSEEAPDPDVLREWLADERGEPLHDVAVALLPAGYANGAWRLDVESDGGTRRVVLKAPRVPSVVYALDPAVRPRWWMRSAVPARPCPRCSRVTTARA
jgi:hypothetical protein